jgi:alanine racemase
LAEEKMSMPALVESVRASHGTWIEIRLDRFRENFRQIKAAAGSAEVMAVIKANAYGHGLVEMARAVKGEAAYLGVSSLHEAHELKEHSIETPVFLFGRLFGQEITAAIKSGITLSISSLDEAQEISQIAFSLGKSTPVHLKIDTGMGRLGIPVRHALPIIEKISILPDLKIEGVYTHFPTADQEDGAMESQADQFTVLVRELEMRGFSFKWRHAANSAAILRLKKTVFNLVRPGLILYGIYPPTLAAFQPVLSLKSRIMLLKRLVPGDTVGYGRDFKVTESCTIATLPIGYSHGYPFHLSNKSFVLYHGKRFPVAGRVSMDFLCVNLGNQPARVGDEVTLLGEDGQDAITAPEMASWAGTIPYEIVTRLAARLPRLYQA